MAAQRSLLRSLVNGARRILVLQVLLSVIAIALTGWTIETVSNALSERARLVDRVIQLEETLAKNDIVAPPPAPVLIEAEPAYPPAFQGAPAASASRFDPRRAIADLFSPPPPISVVVVHVRSDDDLMRAQRLVAGVDAAAMKQASVLLMPPGDVRTPGYFYFDGRQSAAAAALIADFNDAARRAGLAPWSAQLRGVALPARGEFAAERLDVILPALPPPPPPPPTADAAQPAQPS